MLKFFRRTKHDGRSGSAQVRLSPDVRASVCEDGVVFLQIQKGVVFRSNRIGAAIWKGLTDGADLAAVAAAISGQYGVPQQQVQDDAARFISALTAEGLLSGA